VNGFPDSTAYWVRQLNHEHYEKKMDSLFVERVKFVITWFIAWLGIIGVAYAGGIVLDWVVKGFRYNRRGAR
jgi:hypothetical protein